MRHTLTSCKPTSQKAEMWGTQERDRPDVGHRRQMWATRPRSYPSTSKSGAPGLASETWVLAAAQLSTVAEQRSPPMEYRSIRHAIILQPMSQNRDMGHPHLFTVQTWATRQFQYDQILRHPSGNTKHSRSASHPGLKLCSVVGPSTSNSKLQVLLQSPTLCSMVRQKI